MNKSIHSQWSVFVIAYKTEKTESLSSIKIMTLIQMLPFFSRPTNSEISMQIGNRGISFYARDRSHWCVYASAVNLSLWNSGMWCGAKPQLHRSYGAGPHDEMLNTRLCGCIIMPSECEISGCVCGSYMDRWSVWMFFISYKPEDVFSDKHLDMNWLHNRDIKVISRNIKLLI